MRRTGLARSTIYAQIKEGTFPRQVKLGVKASGWKESDIEEWAANREAESDNARAA
jgi:prophage regulatory protein